MLAYRCNSRKKRRGDSESPTKQIARRNSQSFLRRIALNTRLRRPLVKGSWRRKKPGSSERPKRLRGGPKKPLQKRRLERRKKLRDSKPSVIRSSSDHSRSSLRETRGSGPKRRKPNDSVKSRTTLSVDSEPARKRRESARQRRKRTASARRRRRSSVRDVSSKLKRHGSDKSRSRRKSDSRGSLKRRKDALSEKLTMNTSELSADWKKRQGLLWSRGRKLSTEPRWKKTRGDARPGSRKRRRGGVSDLLRRRKSVVPRLTRKKGSVEPILKPSKRKDCIS